MKRIFDLVLCLILFVPAIIFIFVLSILTICFNHFSPFFISQRIGQNGKSFTCFKLQCLLPPTADTIFANAKSDKTRLISQWEATRLKYVPGLSGWH